MHDPVSAIIPISHNICMPAILSFKIISRICDNNGAFFSARFDDNRNVD